MRKQLLLPIFLMLFSTGSFCSQPENTTKDIESLRKNIVNNYVDFVNESVHGLLVINRLLQGYNEDINKYVDLEEYQLNRYSNKDLPADIFEDEEKWFYDISPNNIYRNIMAADMVLSKKESNTLKDLASQLNNINKQSNALRFEIENLIRTLDLNKRENIGLIYQKLEEGTELYNSFYSIQMKMSNELNNLTRNWVIDPTYTDLSSKMDNAYNAMRQGLEAMRIEGGSKDLNKIIDVEYNAFSELNNTDKSKYPNIFNSIRAKNSWNNMISQMEKSIEISRKYMISDDIMEEYNLYGKDYFYYNGELLGCFNKYGLGMVNDMNKLIDVMGIEKIHYMEIAHLFKVVYPNKIENLGYIFSKQGVVSALPKSLANREIKVANEKFVSEDKYIDVEFYDHFIEDGDVISLYFNGDKILEKVVLTKEHQKVRLMLNETGKNYITLYAEDMGSRPPTTMAISYKMNGKEKEVIMNSTLKESELIEILYNK
ncbi:MAG TPA: hypothetical protein PK147_05370 [Saprospiraceae bacterium]|nr:hypothetical protein [Saprospiraceae bacterium]MCB9329391.1 hypothetical protein [Lewinellaceae bacterium]HPK08820.1 hypothetical protein [Saprospiraceae bacterium]HPQ21257.1 hypothetical protein [Saprospiraceae bacterium]